MDAVHVNHIHSFGGMKVIQIKNCEAIASCIRVQKKPIFLPSNGKQQFLTLATFNAHTDEVQSLQLGPPLRQHGTCALCRQNWKRCKKKMYLFFVFFFILDLFTFAAWNPIREKFHFNIFLFDFFVCSPFSLIYIHFFEWRAHHSRADEYFYVIINTVQSR